MKKKKKVYTDTKDNGFMLWLIVGLVTIIVAILALSNASIINQFNKFATNSKASENVPSHSICAADVNRDGVVNSNDVSKVQYAVDNQICTPTGSCTTDVNGDGVLDAMDVKLVKASLGVLCATE